MTRAEVRGLLSSIAARLPHTTTGPITDDQVDMWHAHLDFRPDDLDEIADAVDHLTVTWTAPTFPGPAHLTELIRTRRERRHAKAALTAARQAIAASTVPTDI